MVPTSCWEFSDALVNSPSVRTLLLLLGVETKGPLPSTPELRDLLTPMPAEQLRAVASLLNLDPALE